MKALPVVKADRLAFARAPRGLPLLRLVDLAGVGAGAWASIVCVVARLATGPRRACTSAAAAIARRAHGAARLARIAALAARRRALVAGRAARSPAFVEL